MEDHNLVVKKLAKIQLELKAPKSQRNNFANFNYRSCEDILEAVKPLLNGLTLTIGDEIVLVGDRYYIKANATLTDDSGAFFSVAAYARESLDKKGMDSAQVTGATSSYARKYALNGLFAIDDTKDADTKDNSEEPVRHEQRNETASTAVPKKFWGVSKPSVAQINAVLAKMSLRKEIVGTDDAIAAKKEVTENWTAGICSDYIGNKLDLDGARQAVADMRADSDDLEDGKHDATLGNR